MTKYIFVAGGVMSGVGKGITTASIGRILKSKGFKVQIMKIDPYVNVDAGTMNPIEHGEVFVTDDGTECDQDLGNYERFLEQDLSTDNYLTTGRVYQAVIQRERNLEYQGKCVEVVPHIPEEVINRIKLLEKKTKADIVLVEIGGTVGEYQNLLFLEAARMMKLKNPKGLVFVLVSYLPTPQNLGEMKTKPTQYAVRSLNMAGIQPDIIVARGSSALDAPRKRKLSIFCSVDEKDIISAPDVKSIYEVPLNYEQDDLGNRILKKLGLKAKVNTLGDWEKLVFNINNPKKEVTIGIVGKYFKTGGFTLMDSYISVLEAIKHSAFFFQAKPNIIWFDSESYEANPANLKELKEVDGVIVPGGFGSRGVEGKILAIEYCRKNKIPYFGLCLGMQLAVVEFARNVCGIKNANSTEFSSTCQGVIDLMPEQRQLMKDSHFGATMRLGAYQCQLKPSTLAKKAYGAEVISERHRHRYELNNDFRSQLEAKGLVVAGTNPERNLVEIVELKVGEHPFFLGTQFHPEFKSRPLNPHPLFKEFIKACLK
ncbi:MAG: CTP synthase [Candidatus Gribaldobacteria bacterium]|nr:CTP synthase [Candidatus Gribaldobacteria bacterium]